MAMSNVISLNPESWSVVQALGPPRHGQSGIHGWRFGDGVLLMRQHKREGDSRTQEPVCSFS